MYGGKRGGPDCTKEQAVEYDKIQQLALAEEKPGHGAHGIGAEDEQIQRGKYAHHQPGHPGSRVCVCLPEDDESACENRCGAGSQMPGAFPHKHQCDNAIDDYRDSGDGL